MPSVSVDIAVTGALAALVYAVAAWAQLAVGRVIDRRRIKPVMVSIALGQPVMIGLMATQTDYGLLAASFVAMAFVFNIVNGTLNGLAVSHFGSYGSEWLGDPRFVLGVGLFVAGYAINLHSDAVLRGLRRPGETGYKIPRGGLFRWVSSPNYFGEIVEWCGWALATWSAAGLAFAVFTFANLSPRAVANHRWYREKFPDYPAERGAILPGVW